MARKRKKRNVLPLHVEPDLYERAREAARWEGKRLQVPGFGISTLARQGLTIRIEQVEGERQATEQETAA